MKEKRNQNSLRLYVQRQRQRQREGGREGEEDEWRGRRGGWLKALCAECV